MDTVAILSFISVVVLATVTFIFMSNTRKRIVEIKQDIKTNNLMVRNNMSKVVGDSHFNDDLLNSKFAEYETHTHSELGGSPIPIVTDPIVTDPIVTDPIVT
tara:strand:+ start:359 stop:664 length:306 start_codon:yes stop_codon:yes gene_type:complete